MRFQCPFCGKVLKADGGGQRVRCAHCLGVFSLDKAGMPASEEQSTMIVSQESPTEPSGPWMGGGVDSLDMGEAHVEGMSRLLRSNGAEIEVIHLNSFMKDSMPQSTHSVNISIH